jgi:hypothetical protein
MADDDIPGSDAGAKSACLRADSKSGAQMVRADPAKSWTPRAQERFLDELAATSSVVMAAEAAGFTPATCYYHRRYDPVFARAWDAAKEEGVARVELALVRGAEAALAGRPASEASSGAEWRFPPLTVDQAIAVVRLFRGRDAREGSPERSRRHWHWTPMDPAKAREIILRNVEAVRRADFGQDNEDPQAA